MADRRAVATIVALCALGVGVAFASNRWIGARGVTTIAFPPKGLKPSAFDLFRMKVRTAIGRGEYRNARRLFKSNKLKDDNVSLRLDWLKVLLKTGDVGRAIDGYVGLLLTRSPGWGAGVGWSGSIEELEEPFLLADKLHRKSDAEILGRAIQNSYKIVYSSFRPLNAPLLVPTPQQTIAHAYITLGWLAEGNLELDKMVQYSERANVVDPDDVSIMTQLAFRYCRRNVNNDRLRAYQLLRRADQLLPANSEARRDLQSESLCAVGIDPTRSSDRISLYGGVSHSTQEELAKERAQFSARRRPPGLPSRHQPTLVTRFLGTPSS